MRALFLPLTLWSCGQAAPPPAPEPEIAPPGFEPAGPPMPFAPPEALPPVAAFRQTTSGAWSADGRRVIVRTYVIAWEWDVDPAQPEAFWSETPRRAWLAPEERGEAITYLPDGALLTTSEGDPMPVNLVWRGAR